MRDRSRRALAYALFVSLLTTLLLTGTGLTQAATPLESLNIALWPEYDRSELLVIFRGQVAADVPLPASLSFHLPTSVESLHAVAYFNEERGTLVNIGDYDLAPGPNGNVLTFATPARRFQFEYYSSDMFATDGQLREITFSFTPDADIDSLTLEFQQPSGAEAFTSDPLPSTTQVRQDGLTYVLYEIGPLPGGQSFSFLASYRRSGSTLSVEPGIASSEPSAVELGGGGILESLGPLLIGAGVLLLIGSLVYWFWSQRSLALPEPTSRRSPGRPQRKTQPISSKSKTETAADEKLAAYCHRCGTKFREDVHFCHACGAERHAE